MIPLEIHAKKFMKQNSYGFDSERVIGHKRKHMETVSGCKRKRVFSGKRMSNPISKRMKERVSIPDQDYLTFLELIRGAVNEDCDSGKLVEENVNAGEEDDDDSVDPQYKIFLENAREEGDAYVLEMKKVDGKAHVVKYEEEGEELSDGVKKGGLSKGREKEVKVSMEPKIKDLDGGFGGRKFLSDCPPEMMAGADKNYLQFLKNVWVKDSSFVYVHDNVIQNLEEDIGVKTGSEIPGQPHLSTKFTPHTDPGTSKLAVNESDSDSLEILDSYEKVDYKGVLLKKLKTVLQKPFDPKEYIEKLEDAKTRKPLQKSRITRGRVVSYPTEESSPSYLDLHPDLRNMFNSAMQKNDPLRALALLRCLFFYYKYVSHPGSVVPWKYPSDWLHDMICSCVDNLKCPMKNVSKFYKEL